MSEVIRKDVIIFGGGIAGLWLLNRLRDQGLDAILLEKNKLGSGQTIASQGMIHGGVKYTLGGADTGASQSIAEMPDYWKACMAGQGDIDLRHTEFLSARYFMWPGSGLRSRLTAFLGSKALRGRVEALAADKYPDFFKHRIDGPLYELTDIVLNVPSLLDTLSALHRNCIFSIDSDTLEVTHNTEGGISDLRLVDQTGRKVTMKAKRYVLTCGEGTEDLLQHAGLKPVPMQRRPLHMVMLRHSNPHPINVHCVSDQLSSTPALTITTHPVTEHDSIWYLGGELAESGVNLTEEEQISRAKHMLADYFPWCDFTSASWDTLRINRAEPAQADGSRPDSPAVHEMNNVLVCWPVKLTLAPALANRVLDCLNKAEITPEMEVHQHPLLPFPGIAEPPWSKLL